MTSDRNLDLPCPARSRCVLVVDDHPLYRDALVDALARHEAGLVVRGASSLAQARELASQPGRFALVVADQQLPDGQGMELLCQWPHADAARVLVSGSSEPALAARARRLGLSGFLPKTLAPRRMLAALGTVMKGERWFEDDDDTAAPVLTERQLAVLQGAAAGQSNREIGVRLGVSERTIKDHMTLIFQRLDAGSRAEAVARGAALGLLPVAR